ncbi:V-type ATP synthase subunit H [archaeon BMS3Abin16]|nr:V-type ATP synthase subunit H [archaeon BMS3Abin16]GBE56076.1 V-type ATP synthase subunit H [archaeon BMS3Bbin16]HDY73607.1 hypothetical protein [Euryarchaeota archaeon]
MVEDVLTIVRRTEDEAEGIIDSAKAEASSILNKADSDGHKMVLDLEAEGKARAKELIGVATGEGEKNAKGIISVEEKKAAKLEAAAEKKLDSGVKLIVDSVLKIGGV